MSTRLAVGLCMSVFSLTALARETLPKDVAQFVQQHEACDRMRGDPGAHASQKMCRGTDKQLAQLKQRYGGDPAVMQCLAQFEPGQHGAHGAQAGSATHHSANPQSAEPGEMAMIDPDP